MAVADERHITRAAQRLGMQQPPLSQQIRNLEAELGTELFSRGARGVELTASGRALQSDARAILAAVQRASERVKQVGRGQLGRLSLSFTTSAMLHPFVRRVVRVFRERYPAVELNLQEGNAAEATSAVLSHAATAAFLRIPVEQPPGLALLELLHEELLVALPRSHPLAKLPVAPIALEALAGERFILVRRPGASGIYANVVAACRTAGFEPEIAAEVPHMLTNVSLVAAGFGVSLVPASVGQVNLADLAYRPLQAAPPLTAPLSLAFRSADPDPVLANLVAIARSEAAVIAEVPLE